MILIVGEHFAVIVLLIPTVREHFTSLIHTAWNKSAVRLKATKSQTCLAIQYLVLENDRKLDQVCLLLEILSKSVKS